MAGRKLKGAKYYGAGARGGHQERRTRSPLNAGTIFRPADIIIFHEDGGAHDTDETGCNQWAFATTDGRALYHSKGHVRSFKLNEAYLLPNAQLLRWKPAPLGPPIAAFLLANEKRPTHFLAGVHAMQNTNFEMFLRGELFPPQPRYKNDQEYEEAWFRFTSNLLPRDVIFTVQTDSKLSKFIAWFTEGPFSHCGIYAGNNEMWEIVTSGTRIAPLTTYKGREFRVAAYRTFAPLPEKWKKRYKACKKKTVDRAMTILAPQLMVSGLFSVTTIILSRRTASYSKAGSGS